MKVGIETGNIYMDTDSVNPNKINVIVSNRGNGELYHYKQILNAMYGQKASDNDFTGRAILEAIELQERIEKLDRFILLPSFDNLSLREQDLMRRQSSAMKQYFECLVMRLEMHVDG